MNKSELKTKIKGLVKQIYQSKTQVDIDNPGQVSLDSTRFPLLVKFPELLKVIVSLLTKQYDLFLKDIQWVAPKPTTFRIILGNDQVFYLIFTSRTWICKVEGKKYYLLNINEEENCIESIARILSYGASEKVEKVEVKDDAPAPENEPELKEKPLPKDEKPSNEPEDKPEELKEIEGEEDKTLNKKFLMDTLGAAKLSKLKNFGANDKSWAKMYEKIADKLGIDINEFYDQNMDEQTNDIIFK